MEMNLVGTVILKLATVGVCTKLKVPTVNDVNLDSMEMLVKVDTVLWSAKIEQ